MAPIRCVLGHPRLVHPPQTKSNLFKMLKIQWTNTRPRTRAFFSSLHALPAIPDHCSHRRFKAIVALLLAKTCLADCCRGLLWEPHFGVFQHIWWPPSSCACPHESENFALGFFRPEVYVSRFSFLGHPLQTKNKHFKNIKS